MRDELLDYYESELSFLRQMGAEFAEKYPKVASRLILGPFVRCIIRWPDFEAAQWRIALCSRIDNFPKHGRDFILLVLSKPPTILKAQNLQVWTEARSPSLAFIGHGDTFVPSGPGN